MAQTQFDKGAHMKTYLAFVGAALAEIAGCYAFWAWFRFDTSSLWLIPGTAALALFAYLLTLAESDAAGRAYAAYGGIYIVVAVFCLWGFEGHQPDRWDVIGAAICVFGSSLILFGPRAS